MAGEQDREPLEEEEKEQEQEQDNNNNNNNNNNNSNSNSKAPRLPRWTRQEIVVLIEGKRVAESRLMSRVGSGRALGVVLEPKWASVSSYCKAHGVNRGPVQCRKRWSNLAGDYKKIKDWQDSLQKGQESESESFWLLRNDLRRDRRLPGFFDKEVYDILDNATTIDQEQEGKPEAATSTSTSNVGLVLALGRCSTTTHTYTHTHTHGGGGGGADDVATAQDEEEEVVFFDSAPAKVGIFSDSEKEPCSVGIELPDKLPSPLPISEKQYSPLRKGSPSKGTNVGKDGFFNPEVGDTSGKGRKRKRSSSADRHDDEETNVLQHQLISVLEKNGQMLNAHLQSQNTNSQIDREQRKDHVDSLVAVLGKLADALGRIADKL